MSPPVNSTIQHHPQSTENQPVSADRGSSANNIPITINLGGSTLVVVIVLVAVIGVCGLVMGRNLAKQDQMDQDFRDLKTAYQLEERRKIDLESYMMLNGFKIPSDDTHGPTGNMQRMLPKENQDGRR